MGVFTTKDGFINIGVGGENQWRVFCAALNRPDLSANPDYATQPDRLRHRPALRQELELVLRNRTSAEWLKLFDQHSIPAGPIYKVDEVFSDPQVEHLGMAVEMAGAQYRLENVFFCGPGCLEAYQGAMSRREP